MTDIPDPSDREAVVAWLKTQPQAVSITLATRSALRLLPLLIDLRERKSGETPPPALLACLRATLVSSSARNGPDDETKIAAADAAADAYAADATWRADAASAVAFATAAAYAAAANAAAAAAATAANADADAYDAAYAAATIAAATATAAATAAAWSADAASAVAAAETPGHVLDAPLWHGAAPPAQVAEAWSRLQPWFHAQSPPWTFWADWYTRHLEGTPQNWPLTRQIALRPDADWTLDPPDVIAWIDALRRAMEGPSASELRQAVEKAAPLVLEARRQIGGNFPPEPIEPEPSSMAPPPEPARGPELEEMAHALTRIEAALATLGNEAARNDARDKAAIEDAADTILEEKGRLQVLLEKFTESFASEAGKEAAKLLFRRLPYVIAGLNAVYVAAQALLQTL